MILVWGDVASDVGILMSESFTSHTLRWSQQPKGAVHIRKGGANSVASQIKAFASAVGAPFNIHSHLPSTSSLGNVTATPHVSSRWSHFGNDWPSRDFHATGWRIVQPLSVSGEATTALPNVSTPLPYANVKLLVINFEGLEISNLNAQPQWLLDLEKSNAGFHVLFKFRPGPSKVPHWPLWLLYFLQRHSERVICITDGAAIREDDLFITSGRSWETTLQDVITSTGRDNEHQFRRLAKHLILMFDTHGAIVRERRTHDTHYITESNSFGEQLLHHYHNFAITHSNPATLDEAFRKDAEANFLVQSLVQKLKSESMHRYTLIYKAGCSDISHLHTQDVGSVPGTMSVLASYIALRMTQEVCNDPAFLLSHDDLTSWIYAGMLLANTAYWGGFRANASEEWLPFWEANPTAPHLTHLKAEVEPRIKTLTVNMKANTPSTTNELCDLQNMPSSSPRLLGQYTVFSPTTKFIEWLHGEYDQFEAGLLQDLQHGPEHLEAASDRFLSCPWTITDQVLGSDRETVFKLCLQGAKDGDSFIESLLASIPHFRPVDPRRADRPSGLRDAYVALRRDEIERLRDLESRVSGFGDAIVADQVRYVRLAKSLNVLCFGAPGSGKSYAAKQIASMVLGERAARPFTVNLTMTKSREELFSRLQAVRESTISRKIPVVVFDEFDSDCEGTPFGWLPVFLSPMEDGMFFSDWIEQSLGPCIFFFVGSKFSSADSFSAAATGIGLHRDVPDDIVTQLRRAKGRDFESRFDARLSVPSINPQSNGDAMFILQRFLVLRGMLSRYDKLIDSNGKLSVSERVLRGFLMVSKYEHNIRSLKKLLESCNIEGKAFFERSDLPSRAQLASHVNPAEFLALVTR